MFMNARPRYVSNNRFETFVHSQSPAILHQRLIEMTNSNVNTWSAIRAVDSTTSDIWDQDLDDFGNNENIPVGRL
jgi:hypothetical protein